MHASAYHIVIRPTRTWFNLNLREIWRYRDLIYLFVRRDFVARYKQTILGPLWSIMQPLMTTLIFTVIFSRVAKIPTDALPPVLFYQCGQLTWNYCANSFSANSNTFVSNFHLFGKVYFPRMVVPISNLISHLFAFTIELGTFLILYVHYKFILNTPGFGMDWRAIFLPVLVLQTAALSLGISLITSASTAKYRDLTHAAGLLVSVWMYATPVIYPLSSVPEKWRWVAAINPMTAIVESCRLILLGSGTVAIEHLALSAILTVILLAVGLILFFRVEKTFIDTV
ncbi:MAG: ABC transporter permease [Verrucomicrobiota bacterium]|nr:ABC transporter permease [Verrucomicrobiota bacterium]